MKPVIFFYVQHLLGIGHQMRASVIAKSMAIAGMEVHYISGGFDNIKLDLGDANFHQLPPIKSSDASFSGLMDNNGQIVDKKYWHSRKIAIDKIIAAIKPDAYLIEGFPFARRKFSGEIMPIVKMAKNQNKPIFTSIRDIIVAPDKQKKIDLAVEHIEKYFDKILIHGDENFIALDQSWPNIDKIKQKLHYTGYVTHQYMPKKRPKNGAIIISAGGGAVGEKLLLTSLDLALNHANKQQIWRFLIGPNLVKNYMTKLKSLASGNINNNIIIENIRPDFRELLAKSKLSISQAGYNSVMDLMVTKTPAILIPFAEGSESEQSLRAKIMQQHGLCLCLNEKNLTVATLDQKIKQMAKLPPINHIPFALNGGYNTAEYIKSYILNKV